MLLHECHQLRIEGVEVGGEIHIAGVQVWKGVRQPDGSLRNSLGDPPRHAGKRRGNPFRRRIAKKLILIDEPAKESLRVHRREREEFVQHIVGAVRKVAEGFSGVSRPVASEDVVVVNVDDDPGDS